MSSESLRFLRLPQVIEVTGVARSSLYDLIAEGRFPKPIKISDRCVGWVEGEVREWMRQRIAASRGGLNASAS
jgi:prophage regulatory protein